MKNHKNIINETEIEQAENHFNECLSSLHESLLQRSNYYGQKSIKRTIFILNNFNLVQLRLKGHYFQMENDQFQTEPLIQSYLSSFDAILSSLGFHRSVADRINLPSPCLSGVYFPFSHSYFRQWERGEIWWECVIEMVHIIYKLF